MRKILTRSGAWVEPMLRGDRSRLLCHLQGYLEETAERLVHGLTQAFMKRGLPLSLSCAGCRAQVVNCGLRQWQDLPHRRCTPMARRGSLLVQRVTCVSGLGIALGSASGGA